MEKSIGSINTSYEADCPYCNETSYSDIDHDWDRVEFGDGLPYGTVFCNECKKDFEVEIKS